MNATLAWRRLPKATRSEVNQLAKTGQIHPNPQVAAMADAMLLRPERTAYLGLIALLPVLMAGFLSNSTRLGDRKAVLILLSLSCALGAVVIVRAIWRRQETDVYAASLLHRARAVRAPEGLLFEAHRRFYGKVPLVLIAVLVPACAIVVAAQSFQDLLASPTTEPGDAAAFVVTKILFWSMIVATVLVSRWASRRWVGRVGAVVLAFDPAGLSVPFIGLVIPWHALVPGTLGKRGTSLSWRLADPATATALAASAARPDIAAWRLRAGTIVVATSELREPPDQVLRASWAYAANADSNSLR